MKIRKNFSHKRQAILDAICSKETHPDAESIYNELKKQYPKLSLGTVYRNIAEFKDEGTVSSVAVVRGIERIDGNAEPHPHFICKECNAVIDVDVDLSLSSLSQKISEKYGFECTRADIIFTGICSKCKKAHSDAEE